MHQIKSAEQYALFPPSFQDMKRYKVIFFVEVNKNAGGLNSLKIK